MTLDIDVAATFTADGADEFRVDADFEVREGETVVILGPSGSGKTLLLETIAGFHDHTGIVRRNGRTLSDEPPESRDFGFVFQDYALFPHMTVLDNVGFSTRVSGGGSYWVINAVRRLRAMLDGEEGRVSEPPGLRLLAELGVADLAERYPPTLSGGEQQRVALARALTVDPEVLLLDEPLSSLDVPTRQSLRADLQDVLADVTAIYVTHDRTTARALADRIVVMNDGQVVQTGTADEVFERPASPLVARFTGSNCLPLSAVPDLVSGLALDPVDGQTHAAVRPERVTLSADTDGATLSGTVQRVVRVEATEQVEVTLTGGEASVTVFDADPPEVGTTVGVSIPREAITLC